jgi:hypothetical protein
MDPIARAIEATGIVEDERHIALDQPLQALERARVRLIILLPEETEPDEAAWQRAAARSSAFAFLGDPAEDVYSLKDGRPFRDEG